MGELDDNAALNQVQRLTQIATVNQLVITASDTVISDLQSKHPLKTFEAEEGSANANIQAQIIEALAATIEDELTVLEKRILERRKPTEAI